MNNLFLRTAAILVHLLLNIVIINTITNYDMTGSWLFFILFILILLALLILLTQHVISYIRFLKSKSA